MVIYREREAILWSHLKNLCIWKQVWLLINALAKFQAIVKPGFVRFGDRGGFPDIPMRQYNLAFEFLLQCLLALGMVDTKCADMGRHLHQAATFHPTHRKNCANDSILVASWDIGTGQVDVRKYQIGIWGERSDAGFLVLQE